MSSLRILSNLLKKNVKSTHFMQQQQQLWCGKRATAAACFSTIFSRNNGQTETNGYKELSRLSGVNPFIGTTLCCYNGTLYNYDQKHTFGTNKSASSAKQSDSTKSPAIADTDLFGETANLSAFAKLKLMYKKYWYVAVPVHVGTSIGWVVGFYYLSKSGVDMPALLQYLPMSDTILTKVQNSDMGHWAIAYLCYKVITPARYAVTLGMSTVSIKYLVQKGIIKPMPTKTQIMAMYEQKKADRAAVKAERKERLEQSNKEMDSEKKLK